MAAGNELIRRARRVFGDQAVAHLATGPLSFQRDRAGSAIATPVLEINGFRFGARKEYYDVQMHFHATAPLEALRYDGHTRPFPAPRILEGGRRAADLGRFNRTLAGGFRDPRPLATLMGTGGQGDRTGAVEICHPLDVAAKLCMCAESRAALVAGGVRVIVLGERAQCNLLALHDPALLDAVPAHLPTIHAARVVLVVPEGAAPGNVALARGPGRCAFRRRAALDRGGRGSACGDCGARRCGADRARALSRGLVMSMTEAEWQVLSDRFDPGWSRPPR